MAGANGHTNAQLDASFAAANGRPFAQPPPSPAAASRRRVLTFSGADASSSSSPVAPASLSSSAAVAAAAAAAAAAGSDDARQRRRVEGGGFTPVGVGRSSPRASPAGAPHGGFAYEPALLASSAAAAAAAAGAATGALAQRPLDELRALGLGPLQGASEALLQAPRRQRRHVGKVPYKVLDAPQLADDFYLNLLDWSTQNVLVVGLGSDVYTWNAYTAKVTKLTSVKPDNLVTSVAWANRGNHVAVGTDKGTVELWDAAEGKLLRTLEGHTARTSSLAWAASTLATGARDKSILLRDVRSPAPFETKLSAHKQEVCGLRWSPDWGTLASGGNDNRLLLWSAAGLRSGATGAAQQVPIVIFKQHTAAIKALAWSPHRAGLLASGGGTSDKAIRFFNTNTGVMEQAVDTGSQVCQIEWAPAAAELVSAHGYSTNSVVVWKYPGMSKVASLAGHTTRVLYMALSPDGTSIVTGAGDETLRFWHVFERAEGEAPERATGAWLVADGARADPALAIGGARPAQPALLGELR
jgi:cell division cycle 20-like protein 1 (cofactor of APC complex)